MQQIKQKLEACPNAPVRPVLELCRGARMAKLLVEFTIILYFIKRQELEGESQNLRLINHHFTTVSSHFFAITISIFHENKILTVILRC